jgi:hypothetical protein
MMMMMMTEIKKENTCFISSIVMVWLSSNTLAEEFCHWVVEQWM